MKWFWQRTPSSTPSSHLGLTSAQPLRSDQFERWVVIDIETTGLHSKTDHIVSIAAIGVRVDWPNRKLSIDLADSYETLVRPDTAHKDTKSIPLNKEQRNNALIHGIGMQSRDLGMPTKDALLALQAYVRGAPLLAFHADFDRQFLERAGARYGLERLSQHWLDIADLCTAAYPKRHAQTLDEWMKALNVECLARHRAAADALAECEVLLRVWPMIARQCERWADVQSLSNQN